MKNEEGFKTSIVSEDDKYTRYIGVGYGRKWEIAVPKHYVARFERDLRWRSVMLSKYGNMTWINPPKNRFCSGAGEDNGGVIPDYEKFAVTKFESVPLGYGPVKETDTHIFLACAGGGQGGWDKVALAVPLSLWERFVTDGEWRERQRSKYAILTGFGRPNARKLDENSPDSYFGFIPDEDLN